jgi:hypothetical protein
VSAIYERYKTTADKVRRHVVIKERLHHPVTQFDDTTLMVILHLLAGEMWSCNEKTLRIHESGVARFITQRGGMHTLTDTLAEVSAA